jgi:DNA-directed RNA polymerase subunit beta'
MANGAAPAPDKGLRPQVRLIGSDGVEIKAAGTEHPVNITFQVGSLITVKDGQEVNVGDVLARIPQETSKTRDITGGLPRVAELFERVPRRMRRARRNDRHHRLRQGHQGQAAPGDYRSGWRANEYLISKDKHVTVHDGQVVQKGETIVDGPPTRMTSCVCRAWRRWRATSSTKCRTSTVCKACKINDKHIEVVVRQMLRRVNVI